MGVSGADCRGATVPAVLTCCGTGRGAAAAELFAERASGASSSRIESSAIARASASIVRFDGLPPTNTPAGVFCLASAVLMAAAVGGSISSPSGRTFRVTSGLATACRPYGIPFVDERLSGARAGELSKFPRGERLRR